MCWYTFSYFLLLYLSLPLYGQIHFYHTDRSTIHELPVYFDCLYYTVLENIIDYSDDGLPSFKPTYQVIPYCVRPLNEELSFTNEIKNVTGIRFDYLRQNGINVSDLLSWSAPINLAELYQEYLNDPKEQSASELFYNCTWPWFGSFCQYSFRVNSRRFSSIVRSIFRAKLPPNNDFLGYFPVTYTNLSCYTHLNCTHQGLPLCIDWREICDGEVNCYDDGIDEKNCFQLEANECKEDEFQCRNGMCVPISFFNDSPFNYDCTDGSDEGSVDRMKTPIYDDSPCFLDPAFRCEELSHITVFPHLFCGDGKTYTLGRDNYCANGRHVLKSNDLRSYEENKHLTYDCWFVLYCATETRTRLSAECSIFCIQSARICAYNIQKQCHSAYVIFPQKPIYDGHVRSIYFTNRSYVSNIPSNSSMSPDFLCYDQNRCPFFSDVFYIDELTCLKSNTKIGRYLFRETSTYIDIFRSCLTIDSSGNETHCRHSSHFHCPNTSKCISRQRLVDGVPDCYQATDEIFIDSCQLKDAKYRFHCLSQNKCIPWRNVNDKMWDCIDSDDEPLRSGIKENPSNLFQLICDGYRHIDHPIVINNQNETDETNCDEWPCSNIYTRGDRALTCSNAEDELNQPLLLHDYPICPINHYPCVLAKNFSEICLPFSKFNDTIIDCLGAFDEQAYCQRKSLEFDYVYKIYRCWNDTSCTLPNFNSIKTTCDVDRTILSHSIPRNMDLILNLIVLNGYMLLTRTNDIYFNVMQSKQYPSASFKTSISSTTTVSSINDELILLNISRQDAWWCNRGLTIRYSSIKMRRCLCPPSYYGHRCQYQSQRVSLSLQFQPICSPECHGLYTILVYLIDQRDLIHSHETFTYIPHHDCQTKFNINLLYRNRSKDQTISYHLRVEAYNRSNQPLTYSTSWYIPIQFAFLPVNRVAALLTFPNNPTNENCTQFCGNGQCINYTNAQQSTYCRCYSGWTGIDCTIRYDCRCSSDALCVGFDSNRSICLCPVNRFGPRCLLPSICETNNPCQNGGSCTSHAVDPYRFTCRCQKQYSGVRCEKINNEIIVSFDNVDIPQSMLVYFVAVQVLRKPTFAVLSIRIPYDKNEIGFYFSDPYHIVLSQFHDNYYLIILQENYTDSTSIRTEISPSRRCSPTNELLTDEWPLLRRVKSYHKICRDRPELNCFHDNETFLCLCTKERHANCLEFDFNLQLHQCKSLHDCQSNALCFQDRPCPTSVMCICPECYYGSKCQMTTKRFGLNLDTILSYQIHPNVSFNRQPKSVQFSLVTTIVMFVLGILSGIISLMTFRSQKLREVGCGNYLFALSIIILFLMIIFLFKCLFLLLTQMSLITNRTFLWFNCITMDYLLRSCLSINDWFTACIAIERTVTTVKGVHFNGKKSKSVSFWVIFLVILMTFLSLIHDPIHRYLIDDFEEKRTWCMIKYSYDIFEIYNSIMNIFHFFIPFSINIISSLIIIIVIARNRSAARQQISYKDHLHEQCLTHKHLLISPFVLILLSLPRLIISFLTGCMKSLRDPWLFLIGYFISFVPPLLHIFIFILPSKTYRKELLKVMTRICRSLRRLN